MQYVYTIFKPDISLKQYFLIFHLLLKCFFNLWLVQHWSFVFAVHNHVKNHKALFCQPSLSSFPSECWKCGQVVLDLDLMFSLKTLTKIYHRFVLLTVVAVFFRELYMSVSPCLYSNPQRPSVWGTVLALYLISKW